MLLGELLHDFKHLADQLRIESRGWLVEEHDLRFHGQRPGNRRPLFLTARQLAGVGIRFACKTDALELISASSGRARSICST